MAIAIQRGMTIANPAYRLAARTAFLSGSSKSKE